MVINLIKSTSSTKIQCWSGGKLKKCITGIFHEPKCHLNQVPSRLKRTLNVNKILMR